MARKKKKNAKAGKLLSFLLITAALISIAITINERYLHLDYIPSWNTIFTKIGLIADTKIVIGDNVSVHFIDVGQGDSRLIKSSNYSILIDTGEDRYAATLINYLKSQEVKQLDYVILTHPHSDHIGGFLKIADEFKIQNLLMSRIPDEKVPTTASFTRVLDGIEKHSINAGYVYPGQKIELENSVIDIIGPLDNNYSNLNNYSVVLKFSHGDNSFLFTGDMEKESEDDIYETNANLNAKVLDVAHHGSRSSSQKSILNAVGGKFAVISSGSYNTYNHPTEQTLQRLLDTGYKIYRTDTHGNIVFISDGVDLEIIIKDFGELAA
ncbi:MAG: MBL fold metallo-hydrolase [Oscillospiraceae bacterium]|nr:MBL fold metallo-hydrolase [Oscillospiraceae bacterium]